MKKNYNEIFERNLEWNGQSGDELVSGRIEIKENEIEDFKNFEFDDCWYWDLEYDKVFEKHFVFFDREAN